MRFKTQLIDCMAILTLASLTLVQPTCPQAACPVRPDVKPEPISFGVRQQSNQEELVATIDGRSARPLLVLERWAGSLHTTRASELSEEHYQELVQRAEARGLGQETWDTPLEGAYSWTLSGQPQPASALSPDQGQAVAAITFEHPAVQSALQDLRAEPLAVSDR